TSDPNIIAGGLLAVAFGAYITGSHWHPNRHEDLRPSPRQALSDGAVFWAVGVGSLVVAIYAYLFYRTVGVPLLSDNIAQTFSDINNAPRYTVIVLYNLPIILSLVLLAQASHLRSR